VEQGTEEIAWLYITEGILGGSKYNRKFQNFILHQVLLTGQN
jgi:hypothetical protein